MRAAACAVGLAYSSCICDVCKGHRWNGSPAYTAAGYKWRYVEEDNADEDDDDDDDDAEEEAAVHAEATTRTDVFP